MTNNCTVTVLVAVYNTAAYLRQCLDSLRAQTLADIQVVCVDDASTDGCGALLDRYAAADGRFEVVHLSENHGQAHARNVALQRARGRYICFLDSDDWMHPHCLEQAVNVFTAHPKTDAVLFRTIYYYSETHLDDYPMQPFEQLSGYDAFVASLTWRIHGVYITTADIHRQHPYDETCHAFSDDNTTRLHYLAAEEVRSCEGIYYYRQRSDSTSRAVSTRRFLYLAANQSMKRQLLELHVSSAILDIYENHRWLNVIDLYMFYFLNRRHFSPVERAEAVAQLRAAWAGIETKRLQRSLKWKPGYMPLHSSWALFRLQEEIYFTLRKVLRRLE